jgi:hypothetical protein
VKVFHCDHCEALVFFENVRCVNCDHALAYLPDLRVIGSLNEAGENLWTSPLQPPGERKYRLCENYVKHNVCNWAVPADDPNPLCRSCRLTRVIPDLGKPGNREAWYKLEAAKRRLVYSLLRLRCPLENKAEDPEHGLAFEFLADPETPGAPRVTTGHAGGLITLSVAEAYDAEREKRRVELHEPYRTLLGHFRHEVGHYYWERLVQGSPRIGRFRELFGDERKDYGKALKAHYTNGAPADWQHRFVSAYATSHPWEDWAETWAHYLHTTDTLEIAAACGLSLRPPRPDEPALRHPTVPSGDGAEPFDKVISDWFSLTYVLNNLSRSLGQPDAYPFVLSAPAIEKLRFVHQTIAAATP